MFLSLLDFYPIVINGLQYLVNTDFPKTARNALYRSSITSVWTFSADL